MLKRQFTKFNIFLWRDANSENTGNSTFIRLNTWEDLTESSLDYKLAKDIIQKKQ